MTYQPTAISNDLGNLPHLPGWVTSGRAETFETVAFRSGGRSRYSTSWFAIRDMACR